MQPSRIDRRRLLQQGGLSLGAVALFGLPVSRHGEREAISLHEFQEQLVKTPAQTEGPFYPDRLPLDTDNDLLIINESLSPAVGEVTHLTGKVVDVNGRPISNALVEIWQVDSKGAYLHKDSANREQRDTNFQGYGRFTTTLGGEYYFRTIKPIAYPGRTPHIHVKVTKGGRLEKLLAKSNDQLVDELFLATIGRAPTGPEKTKSMQLLAGDRTRGAEDLLWALLNRLDFILVQ